MPPSPHLSKCVCGKSFKDGSLRRHLNQCAKNKAHVRQATERLQAAARAKKRRAALEQDEVEQEQRIEDSRASPRALNEHGEETPLPQPEYFHDHLPWTARGIQSATTGLINSVNGSEESSIEQPEGLGRASFVKSLPRRPQRSAQSRRLPGRFRDILPEGPAPLSLEPAAPVPVPPNHQQVDIERDSEATSPAPLSTPPHISREEAPAPVYRTLRNAFNVFREYLRKPLRIPDAGATVETLAYDAGSLSSESPVQQVSNVVKPLGNMSMYRLGHWFHSSGGRLSRKSLATLITDVLKADDFSVDELPGAQTLEKLNAALDGLDEGGEWEDDNVGTVPVVGDGWIEESVRIEIPTGVKQTTKSSTRPSAPSVLFDVPGLFRRPLVEVIKAACQEDLAQDFHFEPFRSYQACPDPQGAGETFRRLHDELYASDAWLSEQQKLDNLPPEPGCNLPRAIAALMFWSDATHVSQFGQSKMWPVYLFFGNLSKWLRCKPRSRASHHVAYIPTLPENIQDFIRSQASGKSASAETLRHCKRELFHAVWAHLVQDPDFLNAYRHGIVIKCADGITRRIYPRLFTYSTDYPERHVTSARSIIYEKGYAPGNEHSDHFLMPESLVATENAFSKTFLNEFNFNYFKMLVVDLMHEFELGVWKAVLIHLIRMLYTLGKDAVNEFNRRFRCIGNFGKSTIRSFAYMNVTDMKNWAARTYEDCLQPHNTHILRLLYILSLWHGLAKLRQHTDVTLDHLAAATRMLGKELRFFVSEVCPHFNTTETPKERDARDRREAARAEKSSKRTQTGKGKTSSPLPKTFSLRTVKIHLLGHYVTTIRWFGTTDSYSTQIGELEHRVVKSYYRRGNKKDYIRLATRMQRRSQHLNRITENIRRLGTKAGHKLHSIDRSSLAPLPPFSPDQHHQIAKSRKKWVHIGNFVSSDPSEPALQDFITSLKDHILGRLTNRTFDGGEGSFSDEDRDHVTILNNLLYEVSKIRINYTTYNVQSDQDIINPSVRSRSFIMVQAPETESSRFWYARVLGIYHLQVTHPPSGVNTPLSLQVLWIRWLGEDPEYTGGVTLRRLERIGYVPEGEGAFGFLDPTIVLRGAHLIPSFIFETTQDLLPRSKYWDTEDGDWVNYYVNPFVDRDMLSRYLGTGVGHTSLQTSRTEFDISAADTIPEPGPPPSDPSVAYGSQLDASNEDAHGSSGEPSDIGGAEDDWSEDEAVQGPLAGEYDENVIAWENDDDAGSEGEDLLFDYDYGN
ncbi:hypothetical protein FS837_002719 [Tulasnella sp. UAMH 9824]|nr:hypothetical protein FS837_002719 [Tulasnella sp. UAMH 9824]